MKMNIVLLFLSVFFLSGCSPVRQIGDPIGGTIAEVSDELGGEKKIGKGEDTITIYPQDDKKIKMEF